MRAGYGRLRQFRNRPARVVPFSAHPGYSAIARSVGGTRDISKFCNLIGYAGIPATENKWLIGNAPGPRAAE